MILILILIIIIIIILWFPNAEMVPKFPSCYYMRLMHPSQLKFPSYQNNHCHRVTTQLQLIITIIIIIILLLLLLLLTATGLSPSGRDYFTCTQI